MIEPKNDAIPESKPDVVKNKNQISESHIGSADAFEETENPLSRDDDNISDEKLDEMLGE